MAGVFTVVLSVEAVAEITTIVGWWRRNRPSSPDLFATELRQAVAKIAAQPEIGARIPIRRSSATRAVVLRRTGYVLFYDANLAAATIEVLRVRHGRRKPLRAPKKR